MYDDQDRGYGRGYYGDNQSDRTRRMPQDRHDYEYDERYDTRYSGGGGRGGGPGTGRRSPVDGKRLWAGCVATVVVAVLVAFVCLLIARGVFEVPVLAPKNAGLLGDTTTTIMCMLAAIGAILATALMHLLLLTTPSPRVFFGAIVALITLVFALQPLTDSATSIPTKIATVLVYLITGATIGLSVSQVATYAATPQRR